MLGDNLTDSDSSTLDDLLAGFDLPESQNPETLQQIVRINFPLQQNIFICLSF